jgi:hypothetical protein
MNLPLVMVLLWLPPCSATRATTRSAAWSAARLLLGGLALVQQALDQAHAFYESTAASRSSPARFMPFLRTFAPSSPASRR